MVFQGLCPSRLWVRLVAQGRELARWESSPRYRRSAPNGEGCVPLCAEAEELVSLVASAR